MPERDIESLGVMGWGWRRPGNSAATVAAVVVPLKAINLRNQVIYEINSFTKSIHVRNQFIYEIKSFTKSTNLRNQLIYKVD